MLLVGLVSQNRIELEIRNPMQYICPDTKILVVNDYYNYYSKKHTHRIE